MAWDEISLHSALPFRLPGQFGKDFDAFARLDWIGPERFDIPWHRWNSFRIRLGMPPLPLPVARTLPAGRSRPLSCSHTVLWVAVAPQREDRNVNGAVGDPIHRVADAGRPTPEAERAELPLRVISEPALGATAAPGRSVPNDGSGRTPRLRAMSAYCPLVSFAAAIWYGSSTSTPVVRC